MSDLDALRAEFRPVDVGYVCNHHPAAVKLAERYNAARDAIDPSNEQTVKLARACLRRLMAAVS